MMTPRARARAFVAVAGRAARLLPAGTPAYP
jgi:hypothetical protein